jgi:hypothetical protein
MGTDDSKIGDKTADRTVFAGISPDNGRPMYVMAADAPLVTKWKQAMEYAAGLDATAITTGRCRRKRAERPVPERSGHWRI